MSTQKLTPLMVQYFAIRENYPDSLLLFQVGDFYELFFDDAKRASAFLAIALTKRGTLNGEPIPLCGVPSQALNHYVVKLVRGGFKVAVCDQVEKAVPGIVVKRQVTKVYTPGTLTDTSMLDEKSASYLFSFWPGEDCWGLVFAELMGSQVVATTLPKMSHRRLESELVRFLPDEILLPALGPVQTFKSYFAKQGYAVSHAELDISSNGQMSWTSKNLPTHEWSSDHWVKDLVSKQFSPKVEKTLAGCPELACSVGLLGKYLEKNNPEALSQLTDIHFYKPDDFLVMDAATQKNLEIVKNSQDGSRKNSLFSVMDMAKTAMGSRTIKKWLQRPLVKKESIEQRLDVVEEISKSPSSLFKITESLAKVSDLERVVGRIALGRAILPDFIALKNSLESVPEIKKSVFKIKESPLRDALILKMHELPGLLELLNSSIDENGSANEPIKVGFDKELDRLRSLAKDGQTEILAFEQREVSKTGIPSLKIRYTDAFGYSIEVSKAQSKLVPENYVQKQTLVGRTRYATEELKSLETEILHAREQLGEFQAKVFERVKLEVSKFIGQLRETAQSVAIVDALCGLANVAYSNNYVRPVLNDSREIIIDSGRHPVVEQNCEAGAFTPNNTDLKDESSLWIVTGPNMGGKSTYLRQVALINLMAQIGSFVPARAASLPVMDRIFTRIGSGDNLAAGKSTFLVEMEETAIICREATDKSLVILDEVGRGTSTFDGMALAQAIIEYIFQTVRARCLFATHYHELTHLEEKFAGISNYSLDCKNRNGTLIFTHKLVKGAAFGSFGIQVAELANLPSGVVRRAEELLFKMEQGGGIAATAKTSMASLEIEASRECIKCRRVTLALKNVDLDDLSPRQAHHVLSGLQEKVGE
jgi:DNA mismatch repair protein MutS